MPSAIPPSKNQGTCSRRGGVLAARAAYSAGAPLSLQRKRWERKRRGGSAPSALPPMRNRAKVPLRWNFPGLVPFEPGFPPMRAVLYCHARQVTPKVADLVPKKKPSYRTHKMGRPHKRPPFWKGVERGTRSSPLRLFFPPFLFCEKKWGAVRAGRPPGEGKSPPLRRLGQKLHSQESKSSPRMAAQ